MSGLDHLRKKPPDDGGLLLDTKDRRLKMECEEVGAMRQDLLRQTETEGAREARLQADRANKESKRLQNEARRKKASRAMSPVRSQNSSESDAVMEDVDSSSSDESSDESMNDNVQMTSDTSSHSKLSGMLTDKLEVDENVKSALQHLILRTLNGDGSHSMPVCVVCDQLIIGVEEVCSISKEILQKNKQRLSWPTFESFSVCTDDIKSYNGCKACRNALRGKSNQKRSTPPTKAIANSNIFGQVPEDVVAS
ncbi:hypothetical protein THAOC_33568 [Thalassiosira oceanica]|uniref:Uncharacterized protein n=1 Tax=Thalassiosira oceanica TaxID=159749 RepID=K0R402_THAOC|nr:hypothetical protein THAOC_33568 [Thalassiosira oceanica]|eukprot:EJK47693.1 hypothetical protein THAOC_33568 [Thalassiosira oceanica]